MAAPVLKKNFIQDINKPVRVQDCGDLMFTGDALADTISVSLYDGETPLSFTGTVSCNCIRADGATVPVTGSWSGNTARATLTQACCAIPGPLFAIMKITASGVTTTVLKAVYTVDIGQTDVTVDPGTLVSNVTALIAAIEAAVNNIPSDLTNLMAAIAPTFTSGDYKAGQYVWYSGELYRFAYPHSGSWTGTDVVSVPLGTGLYNADSGLNNSRLMTLRGSPYIKQGYITTDTQLWNNRMSGNDRCAIIPVTSGQSVSVMAGSSYAIIAALKTFDDPATGDTPDFSAATGWTENIKINATTTFSGTVPSDANYLYVWLGSTTYDLTRTPGAVSIDGYDYIKSVPDNVALKASTDVMNAELSYKPELGVTKAPVIASTEQNKLDLNNYITPGTYRFNTIDQYRYTYNTPTGNPDDPSVTDVMGGKLFVFYTSSDSRVAQLFFPFTSNRGFYFRSHYSGGWNSWRQYALTDSPAFTGSPTAPTQDAGDNSTKLATTAYADRSAASGETAAKTYADERIAAEGIGLLLDAQYVHKGLIINNGAWSSASSQYCAVIPVAPGAKLYFKANATGNGNFAVLTAYGTPSAGDTPAFSTATGFTNTITIQNGTSATYTLPDDAKFLYVYLRTLSDGAYQRTPEAMTVDGYDWINGVISSVNGVFRLTPRSVNLRVMQYNCGKWEMGTTVAMTSDNLSDKLTSYRQLLQKYRPDIIGIEEWVDEITVSGSTVSMNAQLFNASYPYNADYISSGSSKGRTLKGKYELTNISRSSISASSYGGSGNVLYSKAHMTVEGRKICAVCTAFLPSTHNSGDPAIRAALMPKLLALLDGEEYAFLIVDLNNGGGDDYTPVSEGDHLNRIAFEYTGANNDQIGFAACMGPVWTDSWRSQSDLTTWKPIDQIYYRNNGKIIFNDYKVLHDAIESLNSDHVPCIADFTLL